MATSQFAFADGNGLVTDRLFDYLGYVGASTLFDNRVPSPAPRDSGFQKTAISQSRYIHLQRAACAWLQHLSFR